MDELVPYSIYDNNGDVFTVFVKKQEVPSLDMDHVKCFRLLNELKQAGLEANKSKWSDTVEENNNVSVSVSVWKPNARSFPKDSGSVSQGAVRKRATGKSGADWKGASKQLLDVCRAFQTELRLSRVPSAVWQKLSDRLFLMGMDYSPEQIREKMRNMKRMFAEAKAGKHKGRYWEFFDAMEFIYDAVIVHITPPANNVTYVISSVPASTSPVIPPVNDFLEMSLGSGPVEVCEPLSEVCEPLSEVCEPLREVCEPLSDMCESLSDVCEPLNDVCEAHNGSAVAGLESEDENNNPFMVPRSPQKKKSKTPSVAVGIRQSPRKTPKRKIAGKAALVWPYAQTRAFVKECMKRKEDIVKERVGLHVWKDVGKELGVSWQICRDKFDQMKLYFRDTILPEKGLLGETLWAYYSDFCELYDIPEDYHDVVVDGSHEVEEYEEEEYEEEDEVQSAAGPVSGKAKLWDEARTLLFLDLYCLRRHLFDSTTSGFKHLYLYSQIAQQLQDYGFNVTGKQCKSKMLQLRMLFRAEFDKANKTGAAPSSWNFFNRMNEIDGGRANMEAPVTVSAGRGLVYTEKGVEQRKTEERGTRTRPQETNVSKGRKPRVQVYKSKPQEIQERNLAMRERITSSIELLTLNFETRSKERMAVLERLEQKLDHLIK